MQAQNSMPVAAFQDLFPGPLGVGGPADVRGSDIGPFSAPDPLVMDMLQEFDHAFREETLPGINAAGASDGRRAPETCHADLKKHCRSARSQLHCLGKHKGDISEKCQRDVGKSVPFLCSGPIDRFCDVLQSGVLSCLMGHLPNLGDNCRDAVLDTRHVIKKASHQKAHVAHHHAPHAVNHHEPSQTATCSTYMGLNAVWGRVHGPEHWPLTDLAGCRHRCQQEPQSCRVWTWHDESCGPWARRCITRAPDTPAAEADPNRWPKEAGHTSGVCTPAHAPQHITGPGFWHMGAQAHSKAKASVHLQAHGAHGEHAALSGHLPPQPLRHPAASSHPAAGAPSRRAQDAAAVHSPAASLRPPALLVSDPTVPGSSLGARLLFAALLASTMVIAARAMMEATIGLSPKKKGAPCTAMEPLRPISEYAA